MKRLVLILLCLPCWLTPALAQTAEEKKAAVEYVRGLQAADGGFLPTPKDSKSSLRACTAALRVLKYFGGKAKDREACAKFVQSCFDKTTSGFADHPGGQPDVATTAVGLMALVELKLPTGDYEESTLKYMGDKVKTFEEIRIAVAGTEAIKKQPAQAKHWLEQIAALRNPDGTYGKSDGVARATGGAVVAVLRLGGDVEHRDRVVQALKEGQRTDGGFGKEGAATSDLESTYRVMRAFAMLKEKPDAKRSLAFVASCRNANGGYGVEPGKPSTVSATYYAAIITHWLEEK
jgi:prenyltransferase beta subunit